MEFAALCDLLGQSQKSPVTSQEVASMSNRSRILALVALLAVCSPALGYHIGGNATANPRSASADGRLFVYCQPPTVITQTAPNDPWLTNALAAQFYDADHGWTVRYHGLSFQGGYTIGIYKAWVDNTTAFTQGSLNYGGESLPGKGGNEIGIHYDAGAGPPPDPSGAGVHWINVLSTNISQLGTSVPSYPYAGGWYLIDDAGNPANNPFYDSGGGLANSTDFVDIPYGPMNGTSKIYAHTYIATGDLGNKVLDIYDGVAWGFNEPKATPEPSTWILTLSGAAFLIVFLAFRHLVLKHPTPLGV
jgi:hypothetical protein